MGSAHVSKSAEKYGRKIETDDCGFGPTGWQRAYVHAMRPGLCGKITFHYCCFMDRKAMLLKKRKKKQQLVSSCSQELELSNFLTGAFLRAGHQ